MAASMDNVFSSLFQSFSTASISFFGLKDFLEVLNTNQLLVSKSSNSIQEMLGHVHSNLSTAKYRLSGLQLLKVIISQCSTEVFQQNAERWLRLLLQIIQGHCDAHVYRLSLQLICEIFEHSKNFSDVSRLIVNNVIQELVPALLTPGDSKMTVDAIACINKCIQTYPGPLGPYKGKIETLVYKELSNGSKSKVIYQCFALLCQCGPGGSRGSKHSDNWFNHCTELLGSLENTLDSLYDGFEPDISKSKKNKACLPLSVISPDQEETCRISALKSRWITLCGCLDALLSEEMEATARIPVDRMIKLACRALSVNSKMVLSKPTSERVLLASILTEIHFAILDVLESFIVCCRKFLLPFTSVMTGLFSQELLWTKTQNCGFNMTYSVLREKIYQVLTVWLKVLDACGAVAVESKIWIEQVLHDCSPYTESLLLNSTIISQSSKSEGVSKKKAKKRGYHEISQGISSQKKVHTDANCKLVNAGLEALYWLVTASGSALDRKSVQAIHSFTIKTLMSIQQKGEKQTPIPYSVPGCRRFLYRVLQACVICPHPQAPPPTQCAVRIFSQGQRDKCLEVSSFCIEAMRVCEIILHPRAPVLNGPIICENIVRIEPTESHLYSNGDGTDNTSAKCTSTESVDHSINGPVRVTESKNIPESESNKVLKRPHSNSDSSDRSKFMKIQTDKSDNNDSMSKTDLIDEASTSKDNRNSSGENNVVEEIDQSEAENLMEDEQEENSESVKDIGDDADEDGNLFDDEMNEMYVATKCSHNEDIMEKCEERDVETLKSDADDTGAGKDCNEEGFEGKTEETIDNDATEEVDNAEIQDEEVTTMMLSFVDADPDED